MEPTDLTPAGDAEFEARLRAGLARPELPDAGFSRRVLARLPAPGRPRRLAVFPALGWAGVAATVLVALWFAATAAAPDAAWICSGLALGLLCSVAAWPLVRPAFSD